MNEHDKKEVMNLIKFKKIMNGGSKMKGYRLNKDKKHVNLIIEGLLKGNGNCPCKVQKTTENLCPCDEFIDTGVCHCGLWVKEE